MVKSALFLGKADKAETRNMKDPARGPQQEKKVAKMSNVAKYVAALAASALLTALDFGLVRSASVDLFLQPYFWVVSMSLAAALSR